MQKATIEAMKKVCRLLCISTVGHTGVSHMDKAGALHKLLPCMCLAVPTEQAVSEKKAALHNDTSESSPGVVAQKFKAVRGSTWRAKREMKVNSPVVKDTAASV